MSTESNYASRTGMPASNLLVTGLALVFLLAPSLSHAAAARIVTVTPVATEIALSLGAAGSLVGVDQTSVLRDSTRKIPRVGYQRALSAEGVLSLRPTLVVGSEDSGPPAALEALRQAKVRVEILSSAHSVDAARLRIQRMGDLLGLKAVARKRVAELDRDLAAAFARRAPISGTKILFLYTRGNTTALVSGAATPADAVIQLAGGTNAVAGFEGYRPLGAEAIAAAAPDVVLVPQSAVEALGGVEAVLALPGVSLTPAGRARRVVVLGDDRLLAFGPSLGRALGTLIDDLGHGAEASR